MRRGYAVVLLSVALGSAWLGCNALLGIESAVLDPDTSLDGAAKDGSRDDALAFDGPPGDAGDAGDAVVPCTDTTSDPANCGACGHDCLGGACAKGACQPVQVARDSAGAKAITVDATHVYWTNYATGELRRAPKDGGASELLFAGPATEFGDGIGVGGNDVYFATVAAGAIQRCAKTGCLGGPTPVVTGLGSASFVTVVDGGTVYWSDIFPGGAVASCAVPCTGPVTTIGPSEARPAHVTADGVDVFWTTIVPSTVRAKLGAAGPATINTSLGFIDDVTASNGKVYFADSEGPSVMDRDGGAPRRLLNQTNTTSIRVDATRAYFTRVQINVGTIYSCPLAGCGTTATILADKQDGPRTIALDDKQVFWANEGSGDAGTVMRVAK